MKRDTRLSLPSCRVALRLPGLRFSVAICLQYVCNMCFAVTVNPL